MSLLRRVLPALALVTAAFLGAGTAAQASPAYVTGYHYYEGYADHPAYGATVFAQFHATNSYSQVWINGSLSCPAHAVHVTKCAWYGNGTNLAHAGVNYTVNGSAQWFQVNIEAPVRHSPAQLWCTPHGSAPVTAITYCPGHIG